MVAPTTLTKSSLIHDTPQSKLLKDSLTPIPVISRTCLVSCLAHDSKAVSCLRRDAQLSKADFEIWMLLLHETGGCSNLPGHVARLRALADTTRRIPVGSLRIEAHILVVAREMHVGARRRRRRRQQQQQPPQSLCMVDVMRGRPRPEEKHDELSSSSPRPT
jgi:hypothetical protein